MRYQEKQLSRIQLYTKTKQKETHLDLISITSCIHMLQRSMADAKFQEQDYNNEGRARHYLKSNCLPKELKHFLHYHTIETAP